METISLILTAVFTGVSSVAALSMTLMAFADRRKRLRDERPNLVAFVRFKPEKSHRSGKNVVSFELCVRNDGQTPLHVIEWLPIDPSDKLDVAPSVCHKTLDPRAVVCGRATLKTTQDTEPLKLMLVTGDCRMQEVTIRDLSYYRTAAETRNHTPIETPFHV